MRTFCLIFVFLLCCLLTGPACGIKAPPLPRDEVVPAPIEKIVVTQAEDGIRVEFTLPATSLDGTPLERIGGYHVVRLGPHGAPVKEVVRFGVTQQMAMPGKKVSYEAEAPEKAGIYRYRVFPMDAYGSRPGHAAEAEFDWDGNRIVGAVSGDTEPGEPSDKEGKLESRQSGKEEK